jgi:hypothetical protein
MTHSAPAVPFIIEDCVKIPRELIAAQYSVTLCLDGMKVNDISFLNYHFQESDTKNFPLQAFTASVCNKCSESTPWEDFMLLGFVVTTNFAPS